jgi:glycerol-3-phosphate acyltransferase PlsY
MIPPDLLASPWFWFAFGYLLGAVPFGLLLTRIAGKGDIRKVGSGNIGTTNVLRAGGKGLAATTLLLDAGKGALAAWLGAKYALGGDILGGMGAFLGHLFPVWLGFRGGKGVATTLGILVAVHWPAFVTFAVVWLLVAAVTRYSSLAGLIATMVAPVIPAVAGRWDAALLFAGMAVLVIAKHEDNIARLRAGTESKIGARG